MIGFALICHNTFINATYYFEILSEDKYFNTFYKTLSRVPFEDNFNFIERILLYLLLKTIETSF